MISRSNIPNDFNDMNVEWINQALRNETTTESKVIGVDVELIGTSSGYMSELARLNLTWTGEGSDTPNSVIAKIPSPDEVTRSLASGLRLYDREVLFYQEIGSESGIRVPRCYYSSMYPRESKYVLLLEDLGSVGLSDRKSECSLSEAKIALRTLATMHAQWWDSERLDNHPWLSTMTNRSLITNYETRYRHGWAGVQERMADRLPPDLVEIGDLLENSIEAIFRISSEGPQTLVHGTFRPENIYFGLGDQALDPVITSWYFTGRRHAASDVAFFIPYSLPTETRIQYEESLISEYHETLIRLGVDGYGVDQLTEHYRLGLIRNLALFVIGDDNLELQISDGQAWSEQRVSSLQAIVDWDCRELLLKLR